MKVLPPMRRASRRGRGLSEILDAVLSGGVQIATQLGLEGRGLEVGERPGQRLVPDGRPGGLDRHIVADRECRGGQQCGVIRAAAIGLGSKGGGSPLDQAGSRAHRDVHWLDRVVFDPVGVAATEIGPQRDHVVGLQRPDVVVGQCGTHVGGDEQGVARDRGAGAHHEGYGRAGLMGEEGHQCLVLDLVSPAEGERGPGIAVREEAPEPGEDLCVAGIPAVHLHDQASAVGVGGQGGRRSLDLAIAPSHVVCLDVQLIQTLGHTAQGRTARR